MVRRSKNQLGTESATGKAKGRQPEANNIGRRPQENRSRAKSEVGKSEERRLNDRDRIKGECKSRVASGHLVA
jgi:hypothetical protein